MTPGSLYVFRPEVCRGFLARLLESRSQVLSRSPVARVIRLDPRGRGVGDVPPVLSTSESSRMKSYVLPEVQGVQGSTMGRVRTRGWDPVKQTPSRQPRAETLGSCRADKPPGTTNRGVDLSSLPPGIGTVLFLCHILLPLGSSGPRLRAEVDMTHTGTRSVVCSDTDKGGGIGPPLVRAGQIRSPITQGFSPEANVDEKGRGPCHLTQWTHRPCGP